jgi:head-tail adaptor
MGVQSGKLIHSLTFQTKTETSDGLGASGTPDWTATLTGVPGAMWPLSVPEEVEFSKLGLRRRMKIRVRFDSSIVASMRIYNEYEDEYYEIITFQPRYMPDKRVIDMIVTSLQE